MTDAVTTETILRQARELISDPARWTQNAAARSAHGHPVPVVSPHAIKWCAIGAIARTIDELKQSWAAPNVGAAWLTMKAVTNPDQSRLNNCSNAEIATFNDAASHEDVMLVFKHAIEAAIDGTVDDIVAAIA